MAELEHQSARACIEEGFDLLIEKEEGFPEYDEALKQNLLDEAQKGFIEAGATFEGAQHILNLFFGQDGNFSKPKEAQDLTGQILKKYSSLYPNADLSKAQEVILNAYDTYSKGFKYWLEKYNDVKKTAHQGTIDCHLDINNEILGDFARRINEYGETENISNSKLKRLIENIKKTKFNIYAGKYEWYKENYDLVKNNMYKLVAKVGSAGIGIHASTFRPEQITYLSGLYVAVIKASIDDIESSRNN